MLIDASLLVYLDKNDVTAPDWRRPLADMKEVYAPVAWPLNVAVATTNPGQSIEETVGLVADFGGAQIFVGLERSTVPKFAKALAMADAALTEREAHRHAYDQF